MRFRRSTSVLTDVVPERPCALLVQDRWNDYNFETLHRLTLIDETGRKVFVGPVKILQRGAKRTSIPESFEQLDDSFCSLGASMDYYSALKSLGEASARGILEGLRDVAIYPHLAEHLREDEGFERSLLRFPDARLALKQAASLFDVAPPAAADALTLSFTSKILDGFDGPHRLDLAFPRPSGQLGRMTAMIGKNRAGKTQLLNALAGALSGVDLDAGKFEPEHRAPVLLFSFSAFDGFTRPRLDAVLGQNYRYFGLLRPGSGRGAKGRASVEHAFDRLRDSLESIARRPDRIPRWTSLLDHVGLFRNEEIENPFTTGDIQRFVDEVRWLSSGHQMVVLVLSGLVDSIQNESFVLVDEPEIHFHPGLLSTMLRLLYSLLEEYRSYAIVATHSPVVVQEIPARSVHVLALDGKRPVTRRYRGESFGANLGEISREAFGVDEDEKSHVSILRELSKRKSREELEALFNGLGVSVEMLLDELYDEARGG
ncbi:MAG: AAA family ATPase [Polyangiaceae bacterium]